MRMNEIVGDWLQSFRIRQGLTLDQIATASRKYESGWTSATLSHMEKGGSKADALPTLMILLATLNDLTGLELTMVDIFNDYIGNVDIAKGYSTSYENVVSALKDNPVSFSRTNADTWEQMRRELAEEDARLADRFPEEAAILEEIATELGNDALEVGLRMYIAPSAAPAFVSLDKHGKRRIVANHYPTMAETRLETRLHDADDELFDSFDKRIHNIDPNTPEGLFVAAICDVLYGHSLDEEAAKRAGEGATPQKRGRMTRVLADEILDYMRKVAAKLED